MAVRYNNASLGVASLLTALGGAVVSNDSLYINWGADLYTDAAGLNMAAYDFALVSIGPEFQGSIGSEGTPWQCDVDQTSSGVLLAAWNGKYIYHRPGSGTGIVHKFVLRPRRSDALWVQTNGTYTTAIVKGGVYKVTSSGTCVNLYQWGGFSQLLKSGPATTLIDVSAGVCEVGRDFDNAYVRAGQAGEHGELRVVEDAVTPALIDNSGDCEYGGGNVTTFYFRPGGRTDFSKLKKNITITNAHVFEGHEIVPPPSGVTITVTNLYAYPTDELVARVAT